MMRRSLPFCRMLRRKQTRLPSGAKLTAEARSEARFRAGPPSEGTWKRDAKSAYENVYRDLARSYAADKGHFTLYRAKGCDACGNSGYKGRVGLHELLIASDTLKRLIQEHARVAEILAVSLEEGMRTLKMDGIEKVLQGITDMPQVRAVCIK